ncbi:MAG: serine/threonine protein kinase [Phycisphaerales bacterium]|nr:serine/threonine protein kinase [Phycisphaerales bacterium]
MTPPTDPQPRPTPKEVFNAAVDLPPDQRAAYLDRACAGDPALRARAHRLLDAHDAGPEFLGSPTADVAHIHAGPLGETVTLPASAPGPRETPGTRIGPYKLLQQIGEGGFGSVFMADQERPVQRRVALKIIKLGMDTRQVVARFEQERQALAMMDHPNIAKVLDAGATETGRPYFVMELVKGEPVTDYCDRHHLPIADRLALFAQVCYAVQHAHTKGVIHRDIKPSNVLVSTQDGRAFAKVIDFGIAKATQQRLTEKTLFTEHQQLIGTPEYMSPEQAEGSLDIDTRTDVYSLGVLLYELLTGTTPFDGRKLRSAAFAEMQRIIREDDPPRPSTRLSQHATLADIATRRRVEPARLGPMLRGDLDWVVMKALEKDRARRYETPGALAQDLNHFLSGRPVDAAPPSAGYRASKFIRRHRGPVFAASLIAAALLAGTGLAAMGYVSAVKSRNAEVAARLAEQARAAELEQQKTVAEAARAAAESQRRRAELVAGFLERVLAAADPTIAGTNRDVTVRAVLGDAARQLDQGDLKAEPISEIEARRALAKTFTLLGDFDRADALLGRAQAIADATADVPPTTLADLAGVWSTLRLEQGRLEESRVQARRALDLLTEALGPDHPSTINAARGLAMTLLDMGRTEEAIPIIAGAMRAAEPLAREHPTLFTDVLETSARIASAQGRHAEAEQASRRALEISRAGGDDTAVLHELNNLAVALVDQGRFAEAGAEFRQAFELAQRILDPDHPQLARLRSNYCTILAHEGRIDEAEKILRDAAEQARAKFGPGNPRLAAILHNLGAIQERAGHHEECEATYRECMAIREAAGLADHIDQANTASSLGLALFRNPTPERLAESEAMLRRALEIRMHVLPPDDPMLGVAKTFLGACLIRQARYAEAEPLLTEGYEGQARAPGIDDEGRENTIDTIIKLYEKWEAAEPGMGHAAKAGPWKQKLADLKAASPAAR